MQQVPWIGSTTGRGCARPFEGDPLECAGRGAIAQLGERLNGIQKVRGSNPLSSTNLLTARIGPSTEGPFDSRLVVTPADRGMAPRTPKPLRCAAMTPRPRASTALSLTGG